MSDEWYVLVVYTTTTDCRLLLVYCARVLRNQEKKCTTKGTIRPRLRAPSFKVICIVAMVLRNHKALWKLRWSADRWGGKMHYQRYEKNCPSQRIPNPLTEVANARWQYEEQGTVLGSLFWGGRYYRYLLRYLYLPQTLYAVTGLSAFYNREWPSILLYIYIIYYIPIIICIHIIIGI